MAVQVCAICNKSKPTLACDRCESPTCKKCCEFVDEDRFELLSMLPEELKNKNFCFNCFDGSVVMELQKYEQALELAKDLDVYSDKQGAETRLIKRTEQTLKVNDCEDKEDALMKLAFLAALGGFDTLVDTKISSKKVGQGKSYKKLVWNGSAIPAKVK